MAARLEGECRRRARAGRPLHAARRRLEPRAARSAAGPDRTRPDAAADRAHPALLRRNRAAERAARRCIEAAARRSAHAPEIPVRRRARLPDARPAKSHAVGRRSAADQPDDGARYVTHENPVRARRAEHRAASARSHADRRGDAAAARCGQYAGRGRARSVGDARGRSIDRHGARPGRTRRHDRVRRHAGRHPFRAHADGRVSRRPQAGRACVELGAPSGRREHAAHRARRRDRAQPARRDGRDSAAAARVRDGRVRLRQIHAAAGRAVSGDGAAPRQGDRIAGRVPQPHGRRPGRRRRIRRSVADRQDHALEPGELRRRVRRNPQAVREGAARVAARLRRGHVQFQLGRRPLPDLRRLGLRTYRNAVPERRLPALPGLRRQPLPRRDSRSAYRARRPCAEHRRRARPDRQRGDRVLRDRRRGAARAAAHRRRRSRIREARPAGADVVRRRSAAAEAGRLPRRIGGGRRRAPRRQRGGARRAGEAVHVRRADHRAALRRHREADAGVRQAARGRPFADRDRAQSRRDPRGRLADRSRPGRRRWRRPRAVRGHARRREGLRGIAYRRRAAAVRPRDGWRNGAGRRRRAAAGRAERRTRAARDRGRGRRADRQCARAQPEGARRRYPAWQVQRDHRRVGLRQVDARVRHPVPRGPAPLPRIAECVCALDRAAGRAAGSRRGVRHSADGGDRAAAVARRPQEHGRDHVRGLALPAAAVCEARPPALHPRRHAGHVANRRVDRRAAATRPSRRARRAARAARRQPQGRVYRSREMGEGARQHASARGRRVRDGRSVAEARSLPRAHDRAAGGRYRRVAGRRGRIAAGARRDARTRQGRDAPARAARRAAPRDAERPFDRARRRGQGAVGQARVPGVRHQLSGARSADVLVQQQAWLVLDLRGHGCHAHARAARGVRRHGARRG
ncbi:LigA [Burkholderia ambifaria MEX-5]|uniref:LigA n=1 Tax=Burkholderia ambifaria MEX-5 TaxID=396597 RepID=B1SY26_9BURK|nr:LigA [Burkholderia ambifaria MEX-5]